MFSRFESWFDSISDGWNPITVRELRRLARSRLVPYMTLLHFGLLVPAYFLALDCMNEPVDEFDPSIYRVIGMLYPTFFVLLFVEAGFLFRLVYLHCIIREGELFDLVPLRIGEKIEGHLGVSFVLSGFFLAQTLPFMVFPRSSLHTVLIGIGGLFVIFIVAQFATLVFLCLFLPVFRSKKMTGSKTVVALFAVAALTLAILCLVG